MKKFILALGALFLPSISLAHLGEAVEQHTCPGINMGYSGFVWNMPFAGGMMILGFITYILVIVTLILGILALIKYIRSK